MSRFFIEVSYKGSHYSGFQVQENAVTVQEEIEKAFATIHRRPVELTGSSRTDAGVHALQNFFHFDQEAIHPQFVYKLNAILPGDISIRQVWQLGENAHCRFDAISRSYEYRIHRRKDPFSEGLSLFYPYNLDLGLMQQAAGIIKEQEYFAAFSKTNTQVKNFRCKVFRSEWREEGEGLYYSIEGNRFLRGMVRQLTASLLKIGRGKLSLDEFVSFFSSDQKCGISVPARGLFLVSVNYPENYFPLQYCVSQEFGN
jgi:tRNA pseudouridine38-40 synthase